MVDEREVERKRRVELSRVKTMKQVGCWLGAGQGMWKVQESVCWVVRRCKQGLRVEYESWQVKERGSSQPGGEVI